MTHSTRFKKTFIILLLWVCSVSLSWSQVPQKMSYQAVVRDASNNLVKDGQIGMRISILQGSTNGTVVYSEVQTTTSNANGLVSVEIGEGTSNQDFSSIDWANGPYFIKTETDPTGGTNYTISGVSQILAVPYALHALSAETVTSPSPETDPLFSAWDKSTGISVAESQISDLKHFTNTDETDPVYSYDSSLIKEELRNWNNSLAKTITTTDTTRWGKEFTEADPLFSAWDKSTGITVKESQISDLKHFTNQDETDPRFQQSIANGITEADTAKWNKKTSFSGNYQDLYNKPTGLSDFTNDMSFVQAHAISGFLSSESDPMYKADSAFIKTGTRSWNNSLAKTIDATDTTWWGRAEADPLFTTSLAFDISAADTTRWGYRKWNIAGNDLYYSAGKVGVGVSTPESMGSAPLNVEGGVLYKGGVSGGAEPGKLFYDPAGNGAFKYFDNTNAEQVLGNGSITYNGGLWASSNGDIVGNTDVICQSSLAVGFDAVAGENFGFATILLKENNTRIKFDDTSSSIGFPANDWQLTANESASGGANYFAIEDLTGATIPFKVMAGAKTNALYVSASSRVGINTDAPVLDLHIHNSNTPGIRLEQDGLFGWAPQTWDVAANEANFFVRDVTNGSLLPFRIRPGAPTNSLVISSSGNVGIGTASPTQKLDIQGAMHLNPTTEPTSPTAGDLYFDSTSNKLRCYDGTIWHDLW